MKTKLRIFSLLMALVMCFSLLMSCGTDEGKEKDEDTETKTEQKEEVKIDPAKDPHGALAAAFAKLGENYGAGLVDISEALEKASTGTAECGFGFAYDGISASLDTVSDVKNGKFSGKINFGYNNISTSADIWYNDDLVVKVPAILGDQAYGIKISTLKEDLDKSPLILEGMGYASADEFFEDIAESFESEADIALDDFIAVFEKMLSPETAKDIEVKFSAEVEKVLKDIDVKVTDDKLDDKDVHKLTFTVTKKDLEAFVTVYADIVKEVYGDMFELMGQDADEIFEEMKESFDEMEDASVPFDFYLDKKTGEILLITFDNEEKDDTYSYVSSLEISFEKDKITFKADTKEGDETYTYSNNNSITFQKVNSGFNLTVATNSDYKDLEDSEYDYGYENEVKISFNRDKDGKFELTVVADGEEMAAEGTLKYDDKSFAFALNSVEVDGEKFEFDLSYYVKAGGKVEKAPAYKNVITMSEGDWTTLVEEIGKSTVIAELAELFADMNTGDEYYDDEYYDDEYYDDEYYDDLYSDFEDYYDDDYYYDDEDESFEDYYDEGKDYYYDNSYEY